MSISHRASLVREFRAMVDPKKKRRIGWPALIKKTETKVGLIPSNDIHSILVSISKCLDHADNRARIHPVRIAPLVYKLMARAIESPETESRTKAGIFGMIPRIGIDWSRHVSSAQSDCICFFRNQFQLQCELILASKQIQPFSIGYLCDAAIYIGIESDEFAQLVAANVIENARSFSPLPLVQTATYLSVHSGECNKLVWQTIAQQAMRDIDTFTPQNIANLFQAFTRAKVTSSDLIAKSLPVLTRSATKMRLSDCMILLDSILLLGKVEKLPADALERFSRSVQRRVVVLYATSPPGLLNGTELLRIGTSLASLTAEPISLK